MYHSLYLFLEPAVGAYADKKNGTKGNKTSTLKKKKRLQICSNIVALYFHTTGSRGGKANIVLSWQNL